jgi:hypothetical protein
MTLLDNGLVNARVGPPLLGSMSLGTFRSNGQNANTKREIQEMFEVVISHRLASSYEREFIRELFN